MANKTKAKPRRKAASAKSAARRKTSTSRRNSELKQIVTMLEDDHSNVEKLFKRYEKMKNAEDEARYQLAPQICAMLTVHATIEEELFYPAAREVLAAEDDLLDEAEVEHASAKQLIADIEHMETGDPMYDAKVKVLGEYVNHHVEEEEDELFPKLKKHAEEQFDGLFEQMKEMRQALEEETGAGSNAKREKRSGASERKSAELS